MILAACSSQEEDEKTNGNGNDEKTPKFMSILTGGTGGTYYPLGGSLQKSSKMKQVYKPMWKLAEHLLKI